MSRHSQPRQIDPVEMYHTPIEGCILLRNILYSDERGEFMEIYNEKAYKDFGLPTTWPQDNISISKAKVLRGLHIQRKNPQGKLVRCISGGIVDVCVDLRPDSPSYLTVHQQLLGENRAMYLPPGTAHGFCVISDEAIVHYKCTSLYDKASDGGIAWNDPDLDIDWPTDKPIISPKDQLLPKLSDYLEGLK